MKAVLYYLCLAGILVGALFGGMAAYHHIEKSACLESGGRWDKSCDCCDRSEETPSASPSTPASSPTP